MRKAGILNRHLSGVLAELGHGDGVLDARVVVRTGEARPYANVLLRCGVFF